VDAECSGEDSHFLVGDVANVEPPALTALAFKELGETFSLVD
jgi:hypothetical protein